MMRRSKLMRCGGGVALSAVLGATLTQMAACKKEEPPPPPPKRAPPPPPPAPEPVDLTRILDSLDGFDARVQFPQEHAPTDEGLAENVALFVSALVGKDGEALRPMLSAGGREVLSQVEQNWWSTDIDAGRVVMLTMGGGGQPRSGPTGISPEVETLVEEMERAVLDAIPDHIRAALSPEQLQSLTASNDNSIFELNTNEDYRNLFMFFRPIAEQLANGDVPQGMDADPEFVKYLDDLKPVYATTVEYIDKIIAVADASLGDVETSDLSAMVVTALQDASGSYVLMWDAQRFDDGWFFSPLPATDELRLGVRDWDGGSLSDYRVELVVAPVVPELPDFDDGDDTDPSRPSGGGGSSTTGG